MDEWHEDEGHPERAVAFVVAVALLGIGFCLGLGVAWVL
jgi:hypothetical protein